MLEAEIWTLRQQINVLRRAAPKKLSFSTIDRLIFVGLYRLFPRVCDALAIVKPDTIVRWHRADFRSYWRCKSRRLGGRPIVPLEIRRLVREMSIANPLWGALRIHGELLKLGIDIGQTSAAKYMARRRGPPSQGWKTFLHNHADGIAAMDLFVVPTISFRLLYGLLIMGHGRREILWFGVTAYPTACMLVSDNGTELTSNAILAWQQEHAVEWHYIAPGKPMQNGFVESFNGLCVPKTLSALIS
jgi:transposase InsO family protein